MKILYVILSCDKYKDTRQKWQRETWLKDIGEENMLYLDSPVGEETYKNAPLKYIQFLSRINFKSGYNWYFIDDYDWFFFCDDDTFVYTDKLEDALLIPTGLPTTTGIYLRPTMIGFKGGEFPIYNLKIAWCSGGAGIALNREAVKNIQVHLRATPRPLVTDETDISLAIWATMASKDLVVIDNKRFSPFNPLDAAREGLKDCITYHYCERKDFYELYDKR